MAIKKTPELSAAMETFHRVSDGKVSLRYSNGRTCDVDGMFTVDNKQFRCELTECYLAGNQKCLVFCLDLFSTDFENPGFERPRMDFWNRMTEKTGIQGIVGVGTDKRNGRVYLFTKILEGKAGFSDRKLLLLVELANHLAPLFADVFPKIYNDKSEWSAYIAALPALDSLTDSIPLRSWAAALCE